MLMGAHKTQNGFTLALTFLERYHKNDDEFLKHFVLVIGDQTGLHLWILKPKSNAVDAHAFLKQAEKV
jgi:hypothetical protein